MSRAVLVCGGTGAIGRSIVETLCAAGDSVAFSGRDEQRGVELADATGARFVAHTDAHDGAPVVTDAARMLGRLDGVVLNAGTIVLKSLNATTADELRTVLHVNVTVPVTQAQAAAELMDGGGSIVAVASNAGLWGEREIGAYSVSKAALVAACRTMAVEYGPRGIRVNTVCPGDTEPGMAASISHDGGEFTMLPPLGRLGRAKDTAACIAFLLSDAAEFINGADLLVDGGMHGALDAGRPR